MPFRLKLAIAMGATPLSVGTLIYVTWRVTRWGWLESAGLLTIFWGLLAVAIGSIALLSHLYQSIQSRPPDERYRESQHHEMWLGGALLAGAVLFLNFPAALFCIVSALDVMSRYMVTVHNASPQSIESVTLAGPGVDEEIGTLLPDARVRRRLNFHGNGPLMFESRQMDSALGGVVDEYVTEGIGGDVLLTIRNDGEFEVVRNFD